MKKQNSLLLCGALLAITVACTPKRASNQEITAAWHAGKTLPVEIGQQFQPELLNLPNDNGYNVLIDIAHQCSFNYMWGLPDVLQSKGYRTISSQASLNTVLNPDGVSRIRIPFDTVNRIYPFAWYPNFEYDVVITQQGDSSSPEYTETECKALVDFVNDGGGLVILANPIKAEMMAPWSINRLAKAFGAEFTDAFQTFQERRYAGVNVDASWEVTGKGDAGSPIRARREMGKGRVIISSSLADFSPSDKVPTDAYVTESMKWVCENQSPVGGEPRLPQTMGGGGAIYPELEGGASGIIIYYAPNIDPKLLSCVEDEFPKITERILQWLPSDPTNEPMYLILSAGDGGGWAVNAFKPKENGIISLSNFGLISIYAHELAHTLGGPSNTDKVKAGESPMPNQGEAHAGWFQGKIDALYDTVLINRPTKQCDKFFSTPEFATLDIKRHANDETYRNEYKKGVEWHKLWYIWQRMDDIFGGAWYPRWRMIQHERWAGDPTRQLTWEESVEDMSIAVGADLFPFFISLKTSLDRPAMGEITYKGEKLTLPAIDIPIIAPGKVRTEPIADPKQPLAQL